MKTRSTAVTALCLVTAGGAEAQHLRGVIKRPIRVPVTKTGSAFEFESTTRHLRAGENVNEEESFWRDASNIDLDLAPRNLGPEGRWPWCVGKAAADCEAHIKQLNPNLETVVLPFGSLVMLEFNEMRVRIFVDEDNSVISEPKVG